MTAQLLAELAEHLSGELRLRPLLERVLRAALELLDCSDGSVGLLEEGGGSGQRYRKEVEVGVVCDVGRTFPVTEGLTGMVLRSRGPVVVADYAEVPGGHLHAVDRARLHAAVGVPVLTGPTTGSTPLGALVVFSSDPARRFTDDDVDLLTLFARHAAVALTAARLHEALSERDRAGAAAREREAAAARAAERTGGLLAEVVDHLAHGRTGPAEAAARCALAASRQTAGGAVGRLDLEAVLREEADWAQRTLGLPVRVVVAGAPRPVHPDAGAHLVLALRTAVLRLGTASGAAGLRVGLVRGDEGTSLLVEDDGGTGETPDAELVELVAATTRLGGTGQVTATPGWGTHLRLHLPAASSPAPAATGVLVVDARPAVRAGLVALLSRPGSGVRVVGEVARAEEVADVVALTRPHVVLMRAPHQQLGVPVVALESLPDDVGAAELAAALHRAVVPEGPPAVETTPREREVLALLERGWSDRQIAEQLVITRKTVEKHVGSLLRKHGVPSRTALVASRLQ